MVDRRVTNGKRIGQLLASELAGLEVGPLAAVSVVEADPDATPGEGGTEAYRIAYHGTEIASVLLYPDHAAVCLHDNRTWPDGVSTDETTLDDASTLCVQAGAAVKRAVDALQELLGAERGRPAEDG